jgi:hypothetical protein
MSGETTCKVRGGAATALFMQVILLQVTLWARSESQRLPTCHKDRTDLVLQEREARQVLG